MIQYLWNQPILLLMALTGLYFVIRSNKVFSQNLHNETDLGFLINRCDKSVQRGMVAGLLRQMPEHASFLSLALMWAAMKEGGAGALFWFAVFSLLLKGVQGAISTLYHYYFYQGEPDGGGAMAAGAAMRRKNQGGGKGVSLLLLGLQAALLLLSLHPFVLGYDGAGVTPLPIRAAVCLLGAAVLLCAKKRPWLTDALVPGLFIVFLLGALLFNTTNLTLALRIAVTDAIQLNRYVFRLSGMGWVRAMGAGAWLCACSFLLQAYSPYPAEKAKFPHPVFYSVYAQLRCGLITGMQLAFGILLLCFELEPTGNAIVQRVLMGFVCFFSLRQLAGALRRLRGSLRQSAAVVLITGGALAVWLDGAPSETAYFGALSVALALGLIAALVAVLSDSGWYFALLEDYRDRYVWHSQPHPHLFIPNEEEKPKNKPSAR